MRQNERGEIATILTIGTLVVIAVTAVVSSLFVNQNKTTGSRAATCVDGTLVGPYQGVIYYKCAAGCGLTSSGTCVNYEHNSPDIHCTDCTGGNGGGGASSQPTGGGNGAGAEVCGGADVAHTCPGAEGAPRKCIGDISGNYKCCGPKDNSQYPSANYATWNSSKTCISDSGGNGDGGGNPALNQLPAGCCFVDSDCNKYGANQKCNIPNGACGGANGKSCNANPNGQYQQQCVNQQCVNQPCDASGCDPAKKCTSNAACQPAGFSCPANDTAHGGKGYYNWADVGTHCICMNCKVYGTGNSQQCGSDTQNYVDGSLCCQAGQPGAGNTACNAYNQGTCGIEGHSCCPKTTAKDPCGTDLRCVSGTCQKVPVKPNNNCMAIADKCSTTACHNAGEGNWICATDGYWCCPPGYDSTPSACAGKTPANCTAYCATGGNGNKYHLINGSYYSEACIPKSVGDMNTYCGCGSANASHSYSFSGKIKGSDIGKAVKASLSYSDANGNINQGALYSELTGTGTDRSYSYSGTFGNDVTNTTQCRVNILGDGNVILGSTTPFTCLTTSQAPDVTIGTASPGSEDTCSGTTTCTGGCVDSTKKCAVFQGKCQCIYQTYIPVVGGGQQCASNKFCGTTCCPNASDYCDGTTCKTSSADIDFTRKGTINVTLNLTNVNPGRDIASQELSRFHLSVKQSGSLNEPCSAFTLNGTQLNATCTNIERFNTAGQIGAWPYDHRIQITYDGRTGVGTRSVYDETVKFEGNEFSKQITTSYDFGSITKTFSVRIETNCARLNVNKNSISLPGIIDGFAPDSNITIENGGSWQSGSITVDSANSATSIVLKSGSMCTTNQRQYVIPQISSPINAGTGTNYIITVTAPTQ